MASIGSLVGVVFAKMGYPIVDSIASIIISLFIIKTSIEIFMDAVNGLIDKACNTETIDKITSILLANDCIIEVKTIKSRLFSSKIYLDIEVYLQNDMNLQELLELTNCINNKLKEEIEEVKKCMIQFYPISEKEIDT